MKEINIARRKRGGYMLSGNATFRIYKLRQELPTIARQFIAGKKCPMFYPVPNLSRIIPADDLPSRGALKIFLLDDAFSFLDRHYPVHIRIRNLINRTARPANFYQVNLSPFLKAKM
jgi:hypothetical protein